VQIPKASLVDDNATSRFALESLLMGATRGNEYERIIASPAREARRLDPTHERGRRRDAFAAAPERGPDQYHPTATSRNPDPATPSTPKEQGQCR
jgi:hypothetical protein